MGRDVGARAGSAPPAEQQGPQRRNAGDEDAGGYLGEDEDYAVTHAVDQIIVRTEPGLDRPAEVDARGAKHEFINMTSREEGEQEGYIHDSQRKGGHNTELLTARHVQSPYDGQGQHDDPEIYTQVESGRGEFRFDDTPTGARDP